jgi:hypothetical protein
MPINIMGTKRLCGTFINHPHCQFKLLALIGVKSIKFYASSYIRITIIRSKIALSAHESGQFVSNFIVLAKRYCNYETNVLISPYVLAIVNLDC